MVERVTQKIGAILTRVRVPGAAKDFSPRVNFQSKLTVPVYPHVKLYASESVHMLKIPNTGCHTIVWTHENTAQAVTEMGSVALAAAVR